MTRTKQVNNENGAVLNRAFPGQLRFDDPHAHETLPKSI